MANSVNSTISGVFEEVNRFVYEGAPNTTLTDATAGGIGTTLTQIAFATIPGNYMKSRTRLSIVALFDATGNDSKDIQIRVGAASGSFATATQIGGQLGLTTQKYIGLNALIWNNNSTQAQRAIPTGQNIWTGTNTSNPSTALTIDTTLDWNIYLGVKFNVADGVPTNSFILRNFTVSPLSIY